MAAFLDPGVSIPTLVGILTGLCSGVGALALGDALSGRRFKRRLDMVRAREHNLPGAAGTATQSLSRRESNTPRIDRLARRWLPRRELLTARLERTGRSISIGQYAIAVLALAAISTLGIALPTRLGIVPSLLLGSLIGIAIPHFVIGRLGKRRIKRFLLLFPEAIELMVRALRSGLPISEAIINAGHEVADPVGSELRLVEAGMRLGRTLEALLWETAKRIDTQEFRFFVVALGVQRETGGNLAETLANLADVLRRRRQMRAKVRAMASEARATTAILGGLPILVIILLELTSPNYLKPMVTDFRGLILDFIGVAMFLFGIFVMKKLGSFEI
jgi:tight adherence protein B